MAIQLSNIYQLFYYSDNCQGLEFPIRKLLGISLINFYMLCLTYFDMHYTICVQNIRYTNIQYIHIHHTCAQLVSTASSSICILFLSVILHLGIVGARASSWNWFSLIICVCLFEHWQLELTLGLRCFVFRMKDIERRKSLTFLFGWYILVYIYLHTQLRFERRESFAHQWWCHGLGIFIICDAYYLQPLKILVS